MRNVDSDLYTTEYFLTENAGYQEYTQSYGIIVNERYKKALELADIRTGMKILDMGCGRGEVVINCAKKGANAIGIDYSANAIPLAEKALEKHPEEIKKNVQFMHMDSKTVAFAAETFDPRLIWDNAEGDS